MSPETEKLMILLQELGSRECRCRKAKKRGLSFCKECFAKLPSSIQGDLYLRVGEGYEEAYRRACEILGAV